MRTFALELAGPATSLVFARWRGDDVGHERWTRGMLAGAIATASEALRRRASPGDRVVVAYPPGPAFCVSLLASMAAQCVAVPTQAPTTTLAKVRLTALSVAAEAAVVLGRAADCAGLALPTLDIEPLATDDHTIIIEGPADRIAYLQYTSGSTGAPRGVAIPFGALGANIAAIAEAWELSPADRGVFWLPPFHDMGLVGGVLAPLAVGFPATLMHPAAFLQRPERWLRLIADAGATFSGGPNFAYDLCVERVPPSFDADLSKWRVAVNGAEPVAASTLDRFNARFGRFGFRSDAFCPGYGLAETVLFATAHRPGSRLRRRARGTQRDLIACGGTAAGGRVAIVDPATRHAVPDGTEGEIWLAGPSVAAGYWRDRAASAETFDARTANGDGPWLRTGDLGIVEDRALFVSGRLKDVVIQAGRKAHAVDIEHAVIAALPTYRRCAAFAASRLGQESLVILLETEAPERLADDAQTLRQAIGEALEFTAPLVVAVPAGAIPTTSSGKLARKRARDAFEAGTLPILASDVSPIAAADAA